MLKLQNTLKAGDFFTPLSQFSDARQMAASEISISRSCAVSGVRSQAANSLTESSLEQLVDRLESLLAAPASIQKRLGLLLLGVQLLAAGLRI